MSPQTHIHCTHEHTHIHTHTHTGLGKRASLIEKNQAERNLIAAVWPEEGEKKREVSNRKGREGWGETRRQRGRKRQREKTQREKTH